MKIFDEAKKMRLEEDAGYTGGKRDSSDFSRISITSVPASRDAPCHETNLYSVFSFEPQRQDIEVGTRDILGSWFLSLHCGLRLESAAFVTTFLLSCSLKFNAYLFCSDTGLIVDTKMNHSCSFCSVQEIDPHISRVKETGSDLSSGTVVRYRGSRVLEGALNGCTFFKDTLDLLESILVAHGYRQGSASPEFRPQNWIYELFFSDYTRLLETAVGYWRCAKGELSGDTQRPRQETSGFLALAYQGMHIEEY
jgi:hypothetical protein